MAEYITADNVRQRLTTVGYEYVADRDMSGSGVGANEEADYILPAIQWAGALVDGAIIEFVDTVYARAANNQWLKDRCLDLAVCRALEVGGRDVPDSIVAASRLAMLLLYGGVSGDGIEIRGAQQTQRVPGLVIPTPHNGPSSRFAQLGPRTRNLS